MAVASSGNVFIADTANGTIRLMTSNGVVSTLAGSASIGSVTGTTPTARFYTPQNLALDNATNIYVADTQNSVIRKITPIGIVSILAGTPGVFGSADGTGPSAQFSGPQGVAVDGCGNVYVADTGNSTIRKLTSSGTVQHPGRAARQPRQRRRRRDQRQIQSAARRGGGCLRQCLRGRREQQHHSQDHFRRRLQHPGGTGRRTFGSFDGTNAGGALQLPDRLAVDASGNIYVTDYNNNTIREVSPAGVVTTLAGWAGMWGSADGNNSSALFFGPAGISLDGSGNLYVIDSGNNTLRRVTPSGGNWVVSTLAGLPGVSGSIDGTGTGAEFYDPSGVAIQGGYVYVADSGNNTIRSQAIPPSILTQPQSQTVLSRNHRHLHRVRRRY